MKRNKGTCKKEDLGKNTEIEKMHFYSEEIKVQNGAKLGELTISLKRQT